MKSVLVLSLLVAAALAVPAPIQPKRDIDFDNYWSLEEIYGFMDGLEAEFGTICEVEMMGRTEEGREIRGLRIASEEHLATEFLPIVLVTAGASARDWISVMAAVNLMHELVEHYEEFRNIIDDLEWFVIPVANPDGYVFSQTEGNRAWVKNRRVNADSDCIGVNIERNFVFNFGLNLQSNDDPCSDEFRGPEGDSEEETKTVQFAVDLTRRFQQAYISIKAGSNAAHSAIAYPFSSNNELFWPNFQDQIGLSHIMADAISRNTGALYRSTSEANIAGFISGTSADYASGNDRIPNAFTIYAPAAGTDGWDVPETEINRIVDEIFFALAAAGNYAVNLPFPPVQ